MTTVLQETVRTNGTGTVTISADQWDALNTKLDVLTGQVQFLAEQAEAERRQRQVLTDLQADLTPMVHDLYDVAVEEMARLEPYVAAEDISYLLRKLARNVRTFNELLDQVESAQDLLSDASPLTKEAFGATVETLTTLEQRGYFGFLRQGGYVLDQVVTSFSEDDVRLLGDNIVLILNTVKALTQPEILQLTSNLTAAFEEVEIRSDELPTSLWGLLGQMRDPEVRRGLAVTLAVLQGISRQFSTE